jgi:hypothetical protein
LIHIEARISQVSEGGFGIMTVVEDTNCPMIATDTSTRGGSCNTCTSAIVVWSAIMTAARSHVCFIVNAPFLNPVTI